MYIIYGGLSGVGVRWDEVTTKSETLERRLALSLTIQLFNCTPVHRAVPS